MGLQVLGRLSYGECHAHVTPPHIIILISMQLAVDATIPACFGGAGGEAVYIGET